MESGKCYAGMWKKISQLLGIDLIWVIFTTDDWVREN